MIRVFIAFILLFAAVCLGIQLNDDPGYVLIHINHWTIETTAWFALFGLILAFLVLHFLFYVVHKIAKTPSRLNHWHAKRQAQKAQATTRKGLIEYSEGYWNKAKNHLIQALPNTDTPLLNYLTAARAAQKMGDNTLRDQYLREAQQSMPEAKIAVELTQAQLQLADHQWEQALATLRHLHDLAPRHPYVLKLLMNLYVQVRDWTQLIALLPSLKKYRVIDDQEYQQLELKSYSQAIIDLSKQKQTDSLITLFNSLPKSLAYDPEIVTEYVHFLMANNDFEQAESLLRRCLKKEFNASLIDLYGLLPFKDQQLVFAETLLKKNPNSAPLYLCLGRLCVAQHLWGKAKHYLEQSIEFNPKPDAYNELGKLYERLNDPFLASHHYKKGLELATQTH